MLHNIFIIARIAFFFLLILSYLVVVRERGRESQMGMDTYRNCSPASTWDVEQMENWTNECRARSKKNNTLINVQRKIDDKKKRSEKPKLIESEVAEQKRKNKMYRLIEWCCAVGLLSSATLFVFVVVVSSLSFSSAPSERFDCALLLGTILKIA